MNRHLPKPRLKHYVARYRKDKELLEKYPQYKEMLERRIKRHEQDIIAYVTSDNFQPALLSFNL